MSSLIDLPAELLEQILSPLLIQDFSRLNRTCRVLHAFLSPRVYYTIDWFWEDDQPCPPLDLLLRTLVNNAWLASHIRVLKLRGNAIANDGRWEHSFSRDDCLASCAVERTRSIWAKGQRPKPSFLPTDMRTIKNLISAIDSFHAHQWNVEFDRGNIDVIVALVLMQSQCIEQLDLGIGFIQHAKFTPKVFRHQITTLKMARPYKNLHTVSLGLDGPSTPRGVWSNLDLFRIFFFLPSVVSVNTILTEPVVFAWPLPTATP
ncbi:uncharacterized protein K460DRAFT_81257 [Cucurbitaria berberidis CBS 394.84]|uniref:F-box domain-containing protein n=1 Tax=Cucurbitaria berberidis CBS 394.84 TaxID=1168544 RepID=A0A9P4LC57_9PLEO|nr:uncharacterized protein K460DRAFT_81257 [Cucurbitaria berberidis CBS 394.84]KAF1848824.1 hypothetical protein K460DRAFT_81257 [Cucurbitaria berberidis CBS 394.84]